MSYSWDVIRSQVRQFRTNLQSIYPIQMLSITKDFIFDDYNNLLFLSNNHYFINDTTQVSRHLLLYQINLTEEEGRVVVYILIIL
jgi:hypothetical protein